MTKPPRSKPLLRDGDPLQSRPIRKRNPAQPNLPFDPMPRRIEPALATLKAKPPVGPEWSYEIKWDGYRIAVHASSDGVRVLTRGGHDWTHRFPAIEEAARALGPASFILDGEAVMLDDEGRSDFNLLQRSLGATGKHGGEAPSFAFMFAFDLLYFDGHDLRSLEYQERRHLLESLLRGEVGAIRLSEEIEGDPNDIFRQACAFDLEGIVGKRLESTYESGRSGDWVKLKCVATESFVIVGYQPAKGFGSFARLLLAAYKGDRLHYVGSVGTGFKERDAIKLRALMDKIQWRRKTPPIPYSDKARIVWIQPTLIAEVAFRGWTTDRKLRHSSFKGLRDRQDNADIYRI